MNSWTLTFIETHPFWALCFACPISMVIIVCAWLVACQIENGINLVLRLANILSNTVVITFRGYAPQSAEAEEVEKDKTE